MFRVSHGRVTQSKQALRPLLLYCSQVCAHFSDSWTRMGGLVAVKKGGHDPTQKMQMYVLLLCHGGRGGTYLAVGSTVCKIGGRTWLGKKVKKEVEIARPQVRVESPRYVFTQLNHYHPQWQYLFALTTVRNGMILYSFLFKMHKHWNHASSPQMGNIASPPFSVWWSEYCHGIGSTICDIANNPSSMPVKGLRQIMKRRGWMMRGQESRYCLPIINKAAWGHGSGGRKWCKKLWNPEYVL